MSVPVLVQLVLAATCLLEGSPSALAAAALLLLVVGLQVVDRHAARRPSRGVDGTTSRATAIAAPGT